MHPQYTRISGGSSFDNNELRNIRWIPECTAEGVQLTNSFKLGDSKRFNT